MQTIQTIYRNGNVIARCWNGWTKSQFDAALSSEGNHKAAAEKLIKKLNAKRDVSWEIKASAPAVPGVRGADNGWVFMIGYKPEFEPLHMSILVRFISSTNSTPAHMKTSSWLNPKARRVYYTNLICGAEIQGNARYAAEIELERINESAKEHGDLIGYKLDQYVQLPDGDRLFTLKSGDK